MLLHSTIYSTLNGFFVFVGGEKTKKRCGGAAGRRGDGGEVEPGRGMAAGRMGMTAAGRPVVLVVCYGVTTIKVCYCTAFVAVSGGGMDYFCTVPTLHRRRRWIVAGGGEAGGGGMVPGGWRGGGGWRGYTPFRSDMVGTI